MGKYIGPKSKIARKFGEAIYGADKVLEKRNFLPDSMVWRASARKCRSTARS